MTITIQSPFKAPPRISKAGFVSVLERRGSFESDAAWNPTPRAERPAEAERIYDYIVSQSEDPGRWLAVFGKESTWGTNTGSVVHRGNTRSLTNARSIRHPDVKGELYHDPIRNSQYVRYQSLYDSMRDGIYRIYDPDFAYQKAGATTIAEIMAIFAPASDFNEPTGYAQTMANWINEWAKEFPVEDEGEMAQIPGFKWHRAKTSHYRKGRTHTIQGYAQHYTAGTNSLNWLSGTSSPAVSATFLIKHNPTLEDRGWQLVAIEDTAWTTGNANPITVSCEYEHTGGSVSDMAITVMAQTIIDTADYVARHKLGFIPLNREGIKGHREWVGAGSTICPDGISMDRLVNAVQKLKTGGKPVAKEIELNGQKIIGGFKGRYEALGPMALSVFGLPQTNEFTAKVNGVDRSVQIFERTVFGWYPENTDHGVPPDDPMHVRSLTIPEASDVRMQAMDKGLL